MKKLLLFFPTLLLAMGFSACDGGSEPVTVDPPVTTFKYTEPTLSWGASRETLTLWAGAENVYETGTNNEGETYVLVKGKGSVDYYRYAFTADDKLTESRPCLSVEWYDDMFRFLEKKYTTQEVLGMTIYRTSDGKTYIGLFETDDAVFVAYRPTTNP